MESVPGHRGAGAARGRSSWRTCLTWRLGDDMAVMRHMLAQLEAAGYEADARIVDTWDYGVPQHRQRLVIVGVRDGGTFEWPEPVERVTLRDAIGDLPVLDPTQDGGRGGGPPLRRTDQRFPAPGTQALRRRPRRRRLRSRHAAVRPDDLEAFQLMKPGTLYSDLPEELRRYRADIFDDKYNRLDWHDLSRSITAHIAKDGYWYIHPDQHRTLTVREAARVQTFPDHFRFAGRPLAPVHADRERSAYPPSGAGVGGAVLEAARSPRVQVAERTSAWRASVRAHLAAWAERDRSQRSWAYPSDPWEVLVGLVLGGKGDVGWPDPTCGTRARADPGGRDAADDELAGGDGGPRTTPECRRAASADSGDAPCRSERVGRGTRGPRPQLWDPQHGSGSTCSLLTAAGWHHPRAFFG